MTTTGLADTLASLKQRLSDWLGNEWQRQADHRDLDRLSRDEFERIAHDLGLSPGDFERLARRGNDVTSQLNKRIRLLGLKIDALHQNGILRDLQRTCGFCDHQATCPHDLASRPDATDWMTYCPSSDILATMAAQVATTEAATNRNR